MKMTSSRSYLLRALYEWIVENQCTPYILVNADYPGTLVPAGYANDGQVVLNVSPSAVRELMMDIEALSFEGRFGGIAQRVYVPIAAVMAIYARENGKGMVFEQEPDHFAKEVSSDDSCHDDDPPTPPSGGRPSLKIVK